MQPQPLRLGRLHFWLIFVLSVSLGTVGAHAQSCEVSADMDDATRNPITAAGQRYFDMAAKGDVASMRQNTIGPLASDFSSVETSIKSHQEELTGAQSKVKSVFLLDASGSAPIPHAEFYCGVFGKNGQTPGSAAFFLDNLPAGKYAVVLIAATGPKGELMFSEVLEQAGPDWKLAGLYIKNAQTGGHDSDWFLSRAHDYKAKGQMHNAWLYEQEARGLITPVPFMSTMATDKLYEESQGLQPADMPAAGKTSDLVAGAATYKLTALFPEIVGSDLDLIVRYESANVSNSNLAYQDNVAVMKALVAKYPEFRDAFAGVVARAVDSSGRDYGTLLAMKEIK